MERKTHEEFVKEVKDLVGNEYTVLGKYINSTTKILIRHNKCGNEYLVAPTKFKQGRRCPICVRLNMRRTHKEFVKEVKDLVGNEYTVLSEYTRSKDKVKIRHNCTDCDNYVYEVMANNFLRGDRCPRCGGFAPKTTNIFKREVKELFGEEYSILGEYKTNKEKILMKHNKCNRTFYMTPHSFLVGKHRCPYCISSKGEEFISRYLDSLNIEYQRQYKFDDCKYKRKLSFDFAILDEETNHILLIEYDGKQHFKKVKRLKNDDEYNQREFNLTQIRDKIKTDYCKSHKGIYLLRLNYKMKDEEIMRSIKAFIRRFSNINF